ncbi:MAG: hypothetical protein JWN60_927 [Acidobacteria bacterium]|jgi:hypothetical protein|nr:hypothetical protein [Acidobacteriota bacterium]
MKNLIKNRAFIIGFFVGLLTFVGINFYSFLPKYNPPCFDCGETSGFPFAWYQSGTSLIISHILWAYLIVDLLITITFSVIFGLIFNLIWSKVSSNRIELK